MTKEGYKPGIAIPPGETLEEYLCSRDMTQTDLAKRLGLTPKTVNEIVKGKAPIMPKTALGLESVFGTSARFWIALEANYQEAKARLEREQSIAAERGVARLFPYSSLAKLGAVPATRKPDERVVNLRSFFGVASLDLVPSILPVAFRKEDRISSSPHALAAWLRLGELVAARMSVSPYSERKVESVLQILRGLLVDVEAEDLQDRLRSLCASCGIVLCFVPHLPKTYANGATKWLAPTKVLVLSLRRREADTIWFNVFHELGHVLLHGKRNVYVSEASDRERGQGDVQKRDVLEEEADKFAAAQLVDEKAYFHYLESGNITERTIRQFARSIGVHPAIVVGRLQHDRLIPFSAMHHLRPSLNWVPDKITYGWWETNEKALKS